VKEQKKILPKLVIIEKEEEFKVEKILPGEWRYIHKHPLSWYHAG